MFRQECNLCKSPNHTAISPRLVNLALSVKTGGEQGVELTEKLRDAASTSGSDLFGHRVSVPLNTTQDYMLYCIELLPVSC